MVKKIIFFMVWAIVSMSTCVAQKIVSVEELKHGVWNLGIGYGIFSAPF